MSVNLGERAEISALQMVMFAESAIERHLAALAETEEANKDKVFFLEEPPTPMETARNAVVEWFENRAKEGGQP